jgi:glutathione peroxidase
MTQLHLPTLSALACWLACALPVAAAGPAKPSAATPAGAAAMPCPSLWQHEFKRLQDEAPQALCQYAGRVALVVNTASYCGFTNQYEGLEALYARYQARGLVVLGFPSNDFGRQEPGSAKEIADFCFNTYGVKFPMFSKTVVVGAGRSPLYAALARASGETPQWNFHKYLVDRQGRVAGSFASSVTPSDKNLLAAIERALQAPPPGARQP